MRGWTSSYRVHLYGHSLEIVHIMPLQGEPEPIYDKYQARAHRLRRQQADEKRLSLFVQLHAAHSHYNRFDSPDNKNRKYCLAHAVIPLHGQPNRVQGHQGTQ